MDLSAFTFENIGDVAHIVMNQPERGNPIDEQFAAEFDQLATECSVRLALRAIQKPEFEGR